MSIVLSFQFKSRRGWPDSQSLYIFLMGYSDGLFLLFEFYSQDRRGWPDMPVTFRDSLRSPYGTPCRRAAKSAVLVQRKVTKRKHTI